MKESVTNIIIGIFKCSRRIQPLVIGIPCCILTSTRLRAVHHVLLNLLTNVFIVAVLLESFFFISAQQHLQITTKLVHFGTLPFKLVKINTHRNREVSHLNQKWTE